MQHDAQLPDSMLTEVDADDVVVMDAVERKHAQATAAATTQSPAPPPLHRKPATLRPREIDVAEPTSDDSESELEALQPAQSRRRLNNSSGSNSISAAAIAVATPSAIRDTSDGAVTLHVTDAPLQVSAVFTDGYVCNALRPENVALRLYSRDVTAFDDCQGEVKGRGDRWYRNVSKALNGTHSARVAENLQRLKIQDRKVLLLSAADDTVQGVATVDHVGLAVTPECDDFTEARHGACYFDVFCSLSINLGVHVTPSTTPVLFRTFRKTDWKHTMQTDNNLHPATSMLYTGTYVSRDTNMYNGFYVKAKDMFGVGSAMEPIHVVSSTCVKAAVNNDLVLMYAGAHKLMGELRDQYAKLNFQLKQFHSTYGAAGFFGVQCVCGKARCLERHPGVRVEAGVSSS